MSSQIQGRRQRTRRDSLRFIEVLEDRKLLTSFSEYGLLTSTPRPTDITSGPDGNLWFAEVNGNKIGRITPSGITTEFDLPANSNPDYITRGPDDNLWFTNPGNNTIGRITTSGTISEFTVLTSSSGLAGITSGPDGNLWFAEQNGNKIGRITTTGTITEFGTGVVSSPYEIVKGSDGNLWFTEINDDKIGKIVPSGVNVGTITLFATSGGAGPRGIAAGSDGNLWFTEGGINNIGKITTAGVVTEFSVPTANSGPAEITSGPGGDLYFAETNANKIGRINTSGTVTAEYAIPTAESDPDGMTLGPDNNVWFTEFIGDQIGSLSVSLPSTLTASNASGTYGGTTTLQVHLTSGGTDLADEPVDFHIGTTDLGMANTNSSGVATISNASLALIHAGPHPGDVTASFAGDSTYDGSNGSADLTVNSAPLTITADNKTTVYGAALPSLTASYTGFVNGDTATSLTTAPTINTTATSASHVANSPYPIAAAGAVDTDYTISYAAGSLTVTAAPLTITADNKTTVYGAAPPKLTATYTGFVNGDTATNLATAPTITTTATSASHVSGSPYPIAAAGAVDTDYTISYVAGSLTVTPAPLTITADDESKVYGQANPAFTASYTGFVNNDTAASLATPVRLTTVAATYSSVGSYSIVGSGATSTDYAISFLDGSLGVTPAPLTIVIDDMSKVYGQDTPRLKGTITGILNDDNVGAVYSTAATQYGDVQAGGYPITFGELTGGQAANYSTTVKGGSVTPGTLTVTPAPLTVLVADQSRVYGQVNPAATGVFFGALNGDSPVVTYGTTATQYSDVRAGGYPITPTGLTGAKAADYSFSVEGSSVTNGTLTVTPAPLAIAVNNLSRPYGQANPTLTGTIAGLLNGDDVSAQYTTAAVASSDVVNGGYSITLVGINGLKAGDYSVTSSMPGSLTVTPASLTITANDASKVYGQGNPGFTVSYSGFQLGQTPSVLSGVLGFSTSATAASHVGQYLVTPNGLTSADYALQFNPGTLSVTPATLTATANNQVATSGQPLPPLTVSYSGFVSGDTPASLAKPVTALTTATSASAPGIYPILAGGGSSTDYTIVDVPGSLTVNAGTNPTNPTNPSNPSQGVFNDYLGTGRSNLAVYLSSIGAFDIRTPDGSDHIIPFGVAGAGQSIPAPGDYDGSGRTELAVYLPSQGVLAYRPADGGPDVEVPFGVPGAGQTIPMPGDYDGSGRTELAAYLPSQALFVYRPAKGGPDVATSFGVTGQGQVLPSPGDYTGVGHDQLAAYLPSFGNFAIRPGGGQPDIVTSFGIPGLGQTTAVSVVVDRALDEMTPVVSAASVVFPDTSPIADSLVSAKARRNSGSH